MQAKCRDTRDTRYTPLHPRRMSKKGGTPRPPARAEKADHLGPSKAKAARNGPPGRWVGSAKR